MPNIIKETTEREISMGTCCELHKKKEIKETRENQHTNKNSAHYNIRSSPSPSTCRSRRKLTDCM